MQGSPATIGRRPLAAASTGESGKLVGTGTLGGTAALFTNTKEGLRGAVISWFQPCKQPATSPRKSLVQPAGVSARQDERRAVSWYCFTPGSPRSGLTGKLTGDAGGNDGFPATPTVDE